MWTTDYMHTRQDRWIQTKLVFTLAKNATKPNPLAIIPLQATRKKESRKTKNATKPNPLAIIPLQATRKKENRKTKETLQRATVTLEKERIKGSNPWCLWWWLLFEWAWLRLLSRPVLRALISTRYRHKSKSTKSKSDFIDTCTWLKKNTISWIIINIYSKHFVWLTVSEIQRKIYLAS